MDRPHITNPKAANPKAKGRTVELGEKPSEIPIPSIETAMRAMIGPNRGGWIKRSLDVKEREFIGGVVWG